VLSPYDEWIATGTIATFDGATSNDCDVTPAPVPNGIEGVPGAFHRIASADALARVTEGDETNDSVPKPAFVPEPHTTGADVTLIAVFAVTYFRHRTQSPDRVRARIAPRMARGGPAMLSAYGVSPDDAPPETTSA